MCARVCVCACAWADVAGSRGQRLIGRTARANAAAPSRAATGAELRVPARSARLNLCTLQQTLRVCGLALVYHGSSLMRSRERSSSPGEPRGAYTRSCLQPRVSLGHLVQQKVRPEGRAVPRRRLVVSTRVCTVPVLTSKGPPRSRHRLNVSSVFHFTRSQGFTLVADKGPHGSVPTRARTIRELQRSFSKRKFSAESFAQAGMRVAHHLIRNFQHARCA